MNVHGEIDRYGPRSAIFVTTLLMILFMVLWTVLPESMVVAGLLALAAIIVDLPGLVAVGLLVAGFLVPVFWSLLYYKRLERSGRLEA